MLCCLEVFGLLLGVDWVLLASLLSPPEFSLFLWRPGEAEAVLLDFCPGWKVSEVRPGLDLALELLAADQVLWPGLWLWL